MLNIFTRLFGSRNQRLLRQYAERVKQANQFADALAAETNDGLRARTDKLRARLVAGETLDQILPEAFATAREAASRWTRCCRKPSPCAARLRAACWACATTTCS